MGGGAGGGGGGGIAGNSCFELPHIDLSFDVAALLCSDEVLQVLDQFDLTLDTVKVFEVFE